jgi:hypothetical protein
MSLIAKEKIKLKAGVYFETLSFQIGLLVSFTEDMDRFLFQRITYDISSGELFTNGICVGDPMLLSTNSF